MTQEEGQMFRADQEFFVLDSDHLTEAETAFYGYTFRGSRIARTLQELDGQEPEKDGAWVYLQRDGNRITITQDFAGCYGIYLFREKDYFALSNSFLYLAEFLRGRRKLTLNREYADYLLYVDLCSSAMTETPAREIICLDRGVAVTIDITSKELSIRMQDYGENTVDPGTEEGLAILDGWRERWANRFLTCERADGFLRADLSGGFDCRLTFALLLSSGVDMGEIYVFSLNDNLQTHAEDYRIASKIAERYGFTLNNREKMNDRKEYYTTEEILGISFYTMLGNHKQMYYRNGRHCRPCYEISGKGGECVRKYYPMTEEKYILNVQRTCDRIYGILPETETDAMRASAQPLLHRTFEELRRKYRALGRPLAEDNLSQYLYRETRCRNHFGRDRVGAEITNGFSLSPLLDPDLHRLKLSSAGCGDDNFLTALIFDRYAPGLLEIEFEGGRSIDPETVAAAHRVNQKHPYEAKTAARTEKKQAEKNTEQGKPAYSPETIDAMMLTAFCSPAFRDLFGKQYSDGVHDAILRNVTARKHHPLVAVYAAFGTALVEWVNSGTKEDGERFIPFLLENADPEATWPVELNLPPLPEKPEAAGTQETLIRRLRHLAGKMLRSMKG